MQKRIPIYFSMEDSDLGSLATVEHPPQHNGIHGKQQEVTVQKVCEIFTRQHYLNYNYNS